MDENAKPPAGGPPGRGAAATPTGPAAIVKGIGIPHLVTWVVMIGGFVSSFLVHQNTVTLKFERVEEKLLDNSREQKAYHETMVEVNQKMVRWELLADKVGRNSKHFDTLYKDQTEKEAIIAKHGEMLVDIGTDYHQFSAQAESWMSKQELENWILRLVNANPDLKVPELR